MFNPLLISVDMTRGYNCDAHSMSSALEYFGGRSWPNVALHNQAIIVFIALLIVFVTGALKHACYWLLMPLNLLSIIACPVFVGGRGPVLRGPLVQGRTG